MARYSESFRVKVVEFLDKGYTIEQTAGLFGISTKSVWTWKKMKAEGKHLIFKHVPRSPHRINHNELLAYVKEHPDAYLREISAHFSVSISTIWNALKRLGVKYKKTQNLSRSKSEKTGKFLEFLKNHDEEELFFVDEAGIDRYLYREHCRAPKGQRIYEAVSGRKFERCSIVAGK